MKGNGHLPRGHPNRVMEKMLHVCFRVVFGHVCLQLQTHYEPRKHLLPQTLHFCLGAKTPASPVFLKTQEVVKHWASGLRSPPAFGWKGWISVTGTTAEGQDWLLCLGTLSPWHFLPSNLVGEIFAHKTFLTSVGH